MKKENFYLFMQSVPKAELHIHIEAVITLESICRLYEKRCGKKMTKAEQAALFTYEDLNGFIKAFLQVQDLFTEVSDFDYVFDDFARYLKGNGITRCEAFFAPSAFVKKGFDYGEMVKNFTKNINKIKKETGIDIKLLVDVSRTFGLENAMTNYQLMKSHPSSAIIGIGLGGAEQKGPCKDFGPVFEKARADGFHAVAHAGEDVGPESVWDAINVLNAERIGHGITSIQDEKLVDYLAQKQIPLEVCPTSNTFTKKVVQTIEEHPIRAFFDKGVLVTVNTDDPVFFKVTLLDEFWALHKKAGFTMDQIKVLLENSFKASFLSDAQKKKAIKELDAAWEENIKKYE